MCLLMGLVRLFAVLLRLLVTLDTDFPGPVPEKQLYYWSWTLILAAYHLSRHTCHPCPFVLLILLRLVAGFTTTM